VRTPKTRRRANRSVLVPFAVAALAGYSGCAGTPADESKPAALLEDARRFETERAYRRAALTQSLVEPENGYSRLRLARYALDDAGTPVQWDALAEHNPAVRPVTVDDLGRFDADPLRPSQGGEGALAPVFADSRPVSSEADLVELGRRAFELWPAQLEPAISKAVDSAASAARYGAWTDARGHVGGFVRVALADGTERFALACASCHARPGADGRLIAGATNADFDLGALKHAAGALTPEPSFEELARWGPGRVDVTNDGSFNPAAIPDLRPLRLQSYLQLTASVRNGLLPLAVRIETLLITSAGEVVRPPRRVAFALAVYLRSLSDAATTSPDPATPGSGVFAANCAACHRADGTASEPVALEVIGTDPGVGLSDRWTGFYRIPSLWGVATRPRLLHDASVGSLEELLDPRRLESLPGHEAGTSLGAEEKKALLVYVRAIGKGD
jgi:cytochrome c553